MKRTNKERDMGLLYAMMMLLALVVAQFSVFKMIGRRLPDLLRALAGVPASPQSADERRLMRA